MCITRMHNITTFKNVFHESMPRIYQTAKLNNAKPHLSTNLFLIPYYSFCVSLYVCVYSTSLTIHPWMKTYVVSISWLLYCKHNADMYMEVHIYLWISTVGFPHSSVGKESTCNAGDLERSPGEGNGYPLQYSGLENSRDGIILGLHRVEHNWVTFTFHFRGINTQKRNCWIMW